MSLDSTNIADGKIRLTANDKTTYFDVPRAYVSISQFLQTSLSQDPSACGFELDVSPAVLEQIVKYFELRKGVEPAPISKPLKSKLMQDVTESGDASFIDTLHSTDLKLLYDVILGALYLHMPSLLHLGSAKVASLIKGHPLDRVKAFLVPTEN